MKYALTLAALAGAAFASVITPEQCAANCNATYNTCVSAAGSSKDQCLSDRATCVGFVPEGDAEPQVCKGKTDACNTCESTYNSCRTAPNANLSFCASEHAGCIRDASCPGFLATASATAAATATSSAPATSPTDACGICQAKLEQCVTAPGADQASCISDFADCNGNAGCSGSTADGSDPTGSPDACTTCRTILEKCVTEDGASESTCTTAFQQCSTAASCNGSTGPLPTDPCELCQFYLEQCLTAPNAVQASCNNDFGKCNANASCSGSTSAPVPVPTSTPPTDACALCQFNLEVCSTAPNAVLASCNNDFAKCNANASCSGSNSAPAPTGATDATDACVVCQSNLEQCVSVPGASHASCTSDFVGCKTSAGCDVTATMTSVTVPLGTGVNNIGGVGAGSNGTLPTIPTIGGASAAKPALALMALGALALF